VFGGDIELANNMFGGEDLEDKILKQNVPGRYSTWERGENACAERNACLDDADPDDESGDEEEEENAHNIEEECGIPGQEEPPKGEGPLTGHKTGVKGVLNHAYDQKTYDEKKRQLNEQKREYEIYKMATNKPDVAVSAKLNQNEPGIDLSDEDYDDDEDDEFMREFRAKRLQELQIQATENGIRKAFADQNRGGGGARVFGQLREIAAEALPEEVDGEGPGQVVVVHLHEPYVRECAAMTRALAALARRHPSVKFLQLQASAGSNAIDPVALPILNVYRGGEVFRCLTRAADAVGGEAATADDIEWLLEEQGGVVFPAVTGL